MTRIGKAWREGNCAAQRRKAIERQIYERHVLKIRVPR